MLILSCCCCIVGCLPGTLVGTVVGTFDFVGSRVRVAVGRKVDGFVLRSADWPLVGWRCS